MFLQAIQLHITLVATDTRLLQRVDTAFIERVRRFSSHHLKNVVDWNRFTVRPLGSESVEYVRHDQYTRFQRQLRRC